MTSPENRLPHRPYWGPQSSSVQAGAGEELQGLDNEHEAIGLVEDVEDMQRRDGMPDRLAEGFEIPQGLAELWVDLEAAVDFPGSGEDFRRPAAHTGGGPWHALRSGRPVSRACPAVPDPDAKGSGKSPIPTLSA